MSSKENQQAYWKANLKIMGVLLSIWFIVSFGCGILFVEQLNQIQFAGFKLGFWMAQQGSLYVFLILIFVYVKKMDALDKKHGLSEEQE
jgi:putative solute:sodium symporter small subunit